MTFTVEQTKQLLMPVNEARVMKDQSNMSYLSQQDVTAHLIRVFGFGGFDTEITSLDVVYAIAHPKKDSPNVQQFDACYRATMRLTIKNAEGVPVATYEDGSTGSATNQRSMDAAHDLAMKSAISLAKKRCAINLGDQFGLSLYNKGQTAALVIGTKVLPKGWDADSSKADVQEGVPEQVSAGVDETVHTTSQQIDGDDVGLSAEQAQTLENQLGAQPVEGQS